MLSATKLIPYLTTNDKGAPAQVGYDLTICEVRHVIGGFVPAEGSTVVINDVESIPDDFIAPNGAKYRGWYLTPGVYSILFDQGCDLGATGERPSIGGFITHRSSMARNGATIVSGIYDPGYKTPQMGAIMHVHLPLHLEYGARVAQIVGFDISGRAFDYNGQWQGGTLTSNL